MRNNTIGNSTRHHIQICMKPKHTSFPSTMQPTPAKPVFEACLFDLLITTLDMPLNLYEQVCFLICKIRKRITLSSSTAVLLAEVSEAGEL